MQKTHLLENYSNLIDSSTLIPILNTLHKEYAQYCVYPNKDKIFQCFKACDYNNLKVVILNPEAYSQEGYATGLALANPRPIHRYSKGLQNIINRIDTDFPKYENISEMPFQDIYDPYFDTSLERWARQGVLLLNTSLTVRKNSSRNYINLWYPFIKELLINLSKYNSGIIYILLGKEPKLFKPFINKETNYILEYDDPELCKKQVYECDGFIKANIILKNIYGIEINWNEWN